MSLLFRFIADDLQNIDTIIDDFEKSEFFPILHNYWPASFDKNWEFWSYDNSFVTYQRSGSVDPELLNVVPRAEIIRYHLYCCEVIERKAAKIVRVLFVELLRLVRSKRKGIFQVL